MEGENKLSSTSSAREACLGATSVVQKVNRGINRMISYEAEQGTLFQGYEFVWIKCPRKRKTRAKHTWQNASIHHSAASADVWGRG